MADKAQISEADASIHDQHPATQLEYPQLHIEASLESLLSHSTHSKAESAALMPRSELSLSESWSSLSERDLAHDDDLHSEVTDTGSLIDFSATSDIQTVDESSPVSDAEDEEDDGSDTGEYARESVLRRAGYRDDVEDRFQPLYSSTYPQQSIRLNDSTVMVDDDGATWLQGSSSFTDSAFHAASLHQSSDLETSQTVGLIKMPMSQSSLKLGQKPFHILYHASRFASVEIKAEVLGKIGAALLNSSEHSLFGDKSESPCYHVIPSEFGPGSRPATADLIPIPTQMHISDCKVLQMPDRNQTATEIHLDVSPGKSIVSRSAKFFESQNKQQWSRPDLLVVVVSQHDTKQCRLDSEKVVEFADRHKVPVLCLRQESSWCNDNFLTNVHQNSLHRCLVSTQTTPTGERESRTLLDVDSFLALDTEQLNQHLDYIITSTAAQGKSPSASYYPIIGRVQQACHQLMAKVFPANTSETPLKTHLRTAAWIVEDSAHAEQVIKSSHRTEFRALAQTVQEYAPLSSIVSRVVIAVALAALTMFTVHLCQPLTNLQISGASTVSVRACMNTSSQTPSMSSVAVSTTPSPVLALSKPLQALDKQVQSWIPAEKAGLVSSLKADLINPNSVLSQEITAEECVIIMPTYLSPSLKIDADYFESREPQFEVKVLRGTEKVPAKVVKQSDTSADILVRRKDCFGKLAVHLETSQKRVCAVIDMENSVREVMTLWIKSLQGHSHQLKTAKRFINEYSPLIELRANKTGLVHNVMEVPLVAAHGIGAAMQAVEKSAIKQAKLCHSQDNQCFIHRLASMTDVLDPVRQARQTTEGIVRNTRQKLLAKSQQLRERADEVARQAQDEILEVLGEMQASVYEVLAFGNSMSLKTTEAFTKAQSNAKSLLRKYQQPNKFKWTDIRLF